MQPTAWALVTTTQEAPSKGRHHCFACGTRHESTKWYCVSFKLDGAGEHLQLFLGAKPCIPNQEYLDSRHAAAADKFPSIPAEFQQQYAEELHGSATLYIRPSVGRKGGVCHNLWQVSCYTSLAETPCSCDAALFGRHVHNIGSLDV
jgi:hypothetical protein